VKSRGQSGFGDYKRRTQKKQEMLNHKMRKDCGPTLQKFRGFKIRVFGVYEPLMHKHNEMRSAKMRNEKGLWAQYFGFSGFGISEFRDSGFRDSGGNDSGSFELPGTRNAEKGLTGFGSSFSHHSCDYAL
jgi:hypothetical protein